MRFDYGLTNPPFTIGTNRMIYVNIIDDLIKRTNKQVSWIGPSGAASSKIYKRYKPQILHVERLNNKEFPVMTDCAMGLIDLEIEKSLTRDIEFVTSTKISWTGKPIERFVWSVIAKDYPKRLPNVRMSQEEFLSVFDPVNGEKWSHFDINLNTNKVPGIVRFSTVELRKKARNYIYTDDVYSHINNLPLIQNKKYHKLPYIPGGSPELAKNLSEMDRDGKISGWFMQERSVSAFADLEPIRKDLL